MPTVADWITYYKTLSEEQRQKLWIAWGDISADPMLGKHYSYDASSHQYAITSASVQIEREKEQATNENIS